MTGRNLLPSQHKQLKDWMGQATYGPAGEKLWNNCCEDIECEKYGKRELPHPNEPDKTLTVTLFHLSDDVDML